MISELISKKKEQLFGLCEKYEVKTLYVFGSALRDDFNQDSDIDILIEFKDLSVEDYTENYFQLRYDLQELFNREVDLLTSRSVRNPVLANEINRSKKLLYAA